MYVPASRYASLPTLTMTGADGLDLAYTATARPRLAVRTGPGRRVGASDRPDLLGWRATGDPTRFWQVADINAVLDPDELTAATGRVLSMPAAD